MDNKKAKEKARITLAEIDEKLATPDLIIRMEDINAPGLIKPTLDLYVSDINTQENAEKMYDFALKAKDKIRIHILKTERGKTVPIDTLYKTTLDLTANNLPDEVLNLIKDVRGIRK